MKIKLKLTAEPRKSMVLPNAYDNLNSSVFNSNLEQSIQSWGATTLSIIVKPYSVVIGIFLIIEPSPLGPSVLKLDKFGDEI